MGRRRSGGGRSRWVGEGMRGDIWLTGYGISV